MISNNTLKPVIKFSNLLPLSMNSTDMAVNKNPIPSQIIIQVQIKELVLFSETQSAYFDFET